MRLRPDRWAVCLVVFLLLVSCGRREGQGNSVNVVGVVTETPSAAAPPGTPTPASPIPSPLSGAAVTLLEIANLTTTTDPAGNYTLQGIPVGATFTVTAADPNQTATGGVTCVIAIHDILTLTVTSSTPPDSCSSGEVSQPGDLVLNMNIP